jgi:acetyl/propionyl-CoA carboxylase alpha subunit
MVAKLIVHGDTREQALARLDEALAQTHIVGLATNVQFLRRVAGTESFAKAQLDTALIPREEAVLFKQESCGLAPGRRRCRRRKPCCTSAPAKAQTRSAAVMAGVRTVLVERRFRV